MAKLKEYTSAQIDTQVSSLLSSANNDYANYTEKTSVSPNDRLILESSANSNAQRTALVGEALVRIDPTVVDKTADYTLTSDDCNGFKTFTNTGASGAVKVTLPTAAAGLQVEIVNTAGQQLDIDAGSAQIAATGITASLVRSSTIGDAIMLACTSSSLWVSSINKGTMGSAYQFQGSSYGFIAAGDNGSAPISTISKFSLSANTTASSHGNSATVTSDSSGCSSTTQGFVCGGQTNPSWAWSSKVDKFNFSSNTSGSSHGNLTQAKGGCVGCSSQTQGFIAGGTPNAGGTNLTVIDKFDYSSNTTASSHGNLVTGRRPYLEGICSLTSGYVIGGVGNGGAWLSSIEKFNYSSNTTASSHGNLTIACYAAGAATSSTDGFRLGAYTSGGANNSVDKFSLASNTTASSFGTMSANTFLNGGVSGVTYGFSCGGCAPSITSAIYKVNYSSNTTASSHGNLYATTEDPSGHQV